MSASGNFWAPLAAAFRGVPERECLRLPGRPSWSFDALLEAAGRAAQALRSLGLEPGDRVLAQVDKSPEALALYLGTLKAGGVYVPLNTACIEAEVAYFLEDAAPKVFVRRPGEELDRAALEARSRRLGRRDGNGKPSAARRGMQTLTLGLAGEGTFAEAMAAAAPDGPTTPRVGGDLAAILYTSGTTGRPKGAMLTHANLESNARALLACWGWRDDDLLLHILPMFHAHGLFIALHCALLSATPTIFLPRFDAAQVMGLLPQARVMMGVPTHYIRLLNQPGFGPRHCANVRLFVCGSAPLAEQTFRAWEARTGTRLLERYGMSETIVIASNPLDGERRAGSVGFPLPGVEVRIADEEGGERPRGQVGLIEMRGPNLFQGYWGMPEKTAADFRPDGFFITGDLGALDEQGRLSIVGRAKDLIISGGSNIHPREIETLLDDLEAVAESAVIGVPHPDFGEAVVALVVPAEAPLTLEQVRSALEGRLARFKHPKQLVNLDALPRNAMGKVEKARLREQWAGLFAGEGRAA